MKQYSIFDECFVDSFAGGGGASTGIEMATGHPVDIAINHDQSAIMMHRRNHPFTEHYIEDIWQVDPEKAVRGRHVRLAWFSPDCKHFSRAKGAALVDKKIRGLAWVVLRWAAKVKPDVIMLENVPEFVTWGPVRKGNPVKSKAGQTYRQWLKQLHELGYVIETRKLCAADYGAPTIRTRFHLIARRDGKPIVWPERSHAPRDLPEVKIGKCLPWRSAAEIINWDLPCPSIFDTKQAIKETYGITAVRPLKDNTLRRIARGLDKFVIKSTEPFIVECNHGGNGHAQSVQKPLNTITSKYSGGVVDPMMMPYLGQHKFNNAAQDVQNPLSTVTSVGSHEVFCPQLAPYVMCNNANNAPHGMNDPVPTVTTGNRNFLVSPTLIQYHTEQSDREVRGQTLDEPIRTVDAANRYGLSAAYMTEYYGNAGDGIGIREPMHTVTAKDREGVTLAHLAHFKGQDKGQSPLDPLMTVTARDGQFADVRTVLVKWDGFTDLHRWGEVRKLLNTYCDYNIADDEVLLLNVCGSWYFISDIGLRMMTPRELYDAMGFPHDYIIDRDIHGNPIKRADQVARCGNAVCPAVAEALVRANLPEYCVGRLGSMEQLHDVMTS